MSKHDKDIAKQLAKEIIEEVKKKNIDKRLHNTRLLMKNYVRLKEHIEKVSGDIASDMDIEYFEYEGDIVDIGDKIFIKSMLRTKMRTAKMLSYIDESLLIISNDMEAKGELHKYRAFEMHFIDKLTNEEIMDILNCGKNSPKRWSDEVIGQLNILLWGIDAIGII